MIDGAQLVVRRGNDSIKSTADLAAKPVGVNLGSNFEQLLRQLDQDGNINIKTYDTGIEHDVALGRTDAFVMDRLSSAELIKKANLPLQLAANRSSGLKMPGRLSRARKASSCRDEVNRR